MYYSLLVLAHSTFLATRATLAAERLTLVSAMTSAWAEPRPPVTLRLMKLSRTMSINSDTWNIELCRYL